MITCADFVAAVALQNKFPLFSKFSRNPGSMPKKYRHVLSTSEKYEKHIAGFLVKSSVGVVGVTVLIGASCWPSSNCILLRKLCPCRRSLITTVQRWCWTQAMVCAVTTLLSMPRLSAQRLAGHIRPVKRFHPAATHFANNEKI